MLTNRDQCEPISDAPRSYRSTVTDTTAANDELIPYSTYVVFVWAINAYGNGPERTMDVTTQAWGGKYLYLLLYVYLLLLIFVYDHDIYQFNEAKLVVSTDS